MHLSPPNRLKSVPKSVTVVNRWPYKYKAHDMAQVELKPLSLGDCREVEACQKTDAHKHILEWTLSSGLPAEAFLSARDEFGSAQFKEAFAHELQAGMEQFIDPDHWEAIVREAAEQEVARADHFTYELCHPFMIEGAEVQRLELHPPGFMDYEQSGRNNPEISVLRWLPNLLGQGSARYETDGKLRPLGLHHSLKISYEDGMTILSLLSFFLPPDQLDPSLLAGKRRSSQ